MSAQQDRYLHARFVEKKPRNSAAFEAGIPWDEGRLIDEALARGEIEISRLENGGNLPSPGSLAPESLDQNASIPAAGVAAASEENIMARPKKVAASVVVEEHKPDFDLAVRIYRKDIKPAASKVGEHAQEMSTAYKDIKKRAHIQPQAAKLAFKLDDMEESKRDDFLRSLNGLLKRLNIFMPTDLVDAAEGAGEAGADVIPSGERPRPQLATVPSDDSDLNGGEHEESGVDTAIAAAAE